MLSMLINNEKIRKAFIQSQSKSFKRKIKSVINPYGDGNSSEKFLRLF